MASVTSRRVTSVASRRSTARPVAAIDFEFQPQEAPLNQHALMSLQSLQRGTHTSLSQHGSNLDNCLRKAAEMLASIAGDINDRGAEEKERYSQAQRKIREKKRNGDSYEPISKEQAAEHEQFASKVDNMTETMYQSMRRVIDDKQWQSEVPDTMKHVADKSQEAVNRAQQLGQEGDESDLVPQPTQIDDGPSSLLQAAQSTNQTTWQALSLHDRYAANNDYKHLYKIVWDARHPGENQPPVPHASLWFPQDESASQVPRTSQRAPVTQNTLDDSDIEMQETADDDDDDIDLVSANQRITCPLTLLPFEHPVSTNKCPHSFEKDAISDLIGHSVEHVPFTDEQEAELRRYGRPQDRRKAEEQMRRTLPKVARCPEAGCEARLALSDLYDDVALLRITKRKLEAKRRQAEQDDDSDEEDADLPRGTQRRRIVALGSSPTGSRRTTLIKREMMSTVPNSQQDIDDIDDG